MKKWAIYAIAIALQLTTVTGAWAEKTSQKQSIDERLLSLSTLSYTEQDFNQWVLSGQLAVRYAQLETNKKAIAALSKLSKSPLITTADGHLQGLQAAMIAFYGRYVMQPVIGSLKAYEQPDVLVILGCNPPVLNERLDRALPLIEKFASTQIILSGKGRGTFIEAQYMRDYLLKHGVDQKRLILEESSLDTMGNAVFSALDMMRKNIKSGRVVVVTSNFHAPRAFFLFRSVLGDAFDVAVALAPYQGGSVPKSMIGHELTSEALSENLFKWGEIGTETPQTKTPCDDLYQMMVHHKLYEGHWDTARQYADVCKIGDMSLGE